MLDDAHRSDGLALACSGRRVSPVTTTLCQCAADFVANSSLLSGLAAAGARALRCRLVFAPVCLARFASADPDPPRAPQAVPDILAVINISSKLKMGESSRMDLTHR